jgi:mono/diheme cytochrome c family protein
MRQALAFVLGLSLASVPTSSAFAASTPDKKLIDHGAYVATAADCQSCHTSSDGKPFAGGLTLQTPFGPLVTPNITPDKQTGIGTWSHDDFANALRHGIDDEGTPLYPAMPYVSYTKMTDADVDALWAYIQTVEPVENKVEVNRLPFPYDVRSSLYAWQALFFKPGRFVPDASKSEEYNRGAYLVEALEHCGSCHTPRNAMGATISDKALQGSTIQEWYAPDISNGEESVIRSWSKERLATFLKGHSGKSLMPPFGPMSEVVHHSTARLKSGDIEAIADYLKSRTPPAEMAAAGKEEPFPREEFGREVFKQQCADCHGANGEGQAGVAAKLAGNEALATKKPYNVLSVLIEGIEPHGIWGEMPSFANALSNQQIADVANYVRTAWGNGGIANVTPNDVAAWRQFASAPSAELDRAMTCPNVPAAWLDDEVRDSLKQLGMGDIDEAQVRKIFEEYSQRFPDVGLDDRLTALTGTYCRDAAAVLPNRTSVIRQELEFAYALSLSAPLEAKQTESSPKP